jgi:hypothetical protein
MRELHDKMEHSSPIEFGTVTSSNPLVISLDLERNMQLDFHKGDFVMPDNLILVTGNRVALAKSYNPNLYVVLFRLRGTFGQAILGDQAAAVGVARLGDHVTGSITAVGTDPQGGSVTVAGTVDLLISTASTKVRAE